MFYIRYIILGSFLCSGALYADFEPGFSLLNKSDAVISVYVDNELISQLNDAAMNKASIVATPFKKSKEKKEKQVKSVSGYSAHKQQEIDSSTQYSPYTALQKKSDIHYTPQNKLSLFVNKFIDWQSKPSTVYIFSRNGKKLYQASFPAGKTIYVHWDGDKLYPQRGRFKGLTGTTDLGYSLEKNINPDDIYAVKVPTPTK